MDGGEELTDRRRRMRTDAEQEARSAFMEAKAQSDEATSDNHSISMGCYPTVASGSCDQPCPVAHGLQGYQAAEGHANGSIVTPRAKPTHPTCLTGGSGRGRRQR